MITITAIKTYGAATMKARITAPTIERAVAMAGPNARVEFPIDGETFFAPVGKEGIDFGAMTGEEIEAAHEAGLPGADDARITREAREAANDLQERVGLMTDAELERALRLEVWSDLQAQVVYDEVRHRYRERHRDTAA